MPEIGRRQLAAIMFTDIVGYSRVMQEDETRGRMLRERHRLVFEQCTNRHNGRIVQYFGDGTLSVFDSAVSAVECAVCMQKSLKTYPQVPLRIGIHLGDIHYDETEVYGHGVNVAARIEPVCNPGGIFISSKIFDEIQNHPWLNAKSIGVYKFKNIEQELELFAVDAKDVSMPNAEDLEIVKQLSQRVNFSGSGMQSRAIQRFVREQKRRRQRRIGLVAAVTLVMMLAFAAIGRYVMDGEISISQVEEGPTSIAVLPFANMTMDQGNEYFSDGMTEDILTKLSKIEGVSVTSRTSVMQYKDTNKSTRQIARELGVNHILEGSVRRDGQRVRITAQLIDADSDRHIWADTYDEQLTNIFDVQSQVAADIASQLKLELTDEELRDMAGGKKYNVDAYDLYLRGREYYRRYTPEDNETAIDLFREALDIEENFAFAYAGLGDAYAQKARFNGMDQTLLDTAVLMSATAVDADPEMSEGYKALGLAFHYQGKLEQAMTQYEKALELDPYNDMASNNLGLIKRDRGDFPDAAKWAKRTWELNKNMPASSVNMADLYVNIGELEKAERIIDAGLRVNPNAMELKMMQGHIQLRKGELEEARNTAQTVIELAPDNPVGYDLMAHLMMHEDQWKSAEDYFREAGRYATKDYEKISYKVLKDYAELMHSGDDAEPEDWQKLLAELNEITSERSIENLTALLLKAAVLERLERPDEAVENIENATKAYWIDYESGIFNPMFKELESYPEYKRILENNRRRLDSLRREVSVVVDSEDT